MKKISWFFIINILLGVMIHFIPYAFLSMNIKSDNANHLKFYYYNGDEKFRYDELHQFEKKIEYSSDFKKIFIVVPKASLEKLRIDFLGNKGIYEIKNMVVYHELFQYDYLSPAQIMASYHKINHMEQSISKNGSLKLQILDEDAYIYGDKWSYDKKLNKIVIGIELLVLFFVFGYRRKVVTATLLQINKQLCNVVKLHNCFVTDIQNFVQYYKENYIVIVLMLFYLLFAYGFRIFNYSFAIDSEFAIFISNMDGWTRDGRFGIALLKNSMGTLPLVPYIANFLAVVGMGFLALLWNYVLVVANPKSLGDRYVAIIFTLLFVSYPSSAQYMNFSTYNLEVTLGQIFSVIAVYLISQWIFNQRHTLYVVYGILFMVFSLSIYQAMFTLYIVGCCIYLLVQVYIGNEFVAGVPKIRMILGKYISTFGSGILLYYLLHKVSNLNVQQFNYLDGFIGWGKLDCKMILDHIVLYAYDMMSGNSVYRGEFYGISIGIGLLLSCLFWYKNKGRSLLPILLVTIIIFSPFILPVVLGGVVPIRSQLVLPLIVAISAYWLYFIWNFQCGVKRLLVLVCVCISFYQASGIATLFYGEYLKSQMDVAMAHKIAHEIEVVKKDNDKAKTVFFMGKYKYVFHQNAIRQQEMIGRSFFAHGDSNRISLFMQSLGYGRIVPIITMDEVVNFPKERYEQMKRDAKQMPKWPQQGSVLEQDDLIIVKFSDDF